MIRTDADEDAMRGSLEEVVDLFEQAKGSVFKLMASVRIPTTPLCSMLTHARIPCPNSFAIQATRPFYESTTSIYLETTEHFLLVQKGQH